MKNLKILFFLIFLFITGCASTCMEYRSATTAARSEKNLKRAEEWGLKALESPECNPAIDAYAPYFLATEVYLKQKKYAEMAKMLDIAVQRNPNQPLETPFKLGDKPVETIGEGVEAFRNQEWAKIYNKAVDNIHKDKIDKAKNEIEIAILIYPKKGENYSTLAAIYLENKDMDGALTTVNRGLEADDTNSALHQFKGDMSSQKNDLETAQASYQKAIEYTDNPGPIMRKLLFVYIDMGNNQRAIDYSNELLDKYPNDADLYYNIGVLYQRLTLEMFDPARELFLTTTDESPEKIIREVQDSFITTRKYAYNSKDFFLQASDLELDENLSTRDAVSEMGKLMDQIDELFIPSIRETARSAGIELD